MFVYRIKTSNSRPANIDTLLVSPKLVNKSIVAMKNVCPKSVL